MRLPIGPTIVAILFGCVLGAPEDGMAQNFETCIPQLCGETVTVFAYPGECFNYQRYMGPEWKDCVGSDKDPTIGWETCIPRECSQTVNARPSLAACLIDYYNLQQVDSGYKKCTRRNGVASRLEAQEVCPPSDPNCDGGPAQQAEVTTGGGSPHPARPSLGEVTRSSRAGSRSIRL